jgi:hypothetical protein
VLAVLSLLLFLFCASLPALAADDRSGAGLGFTSGIVDMEFLPAELDFVGYTLFWKFGFTDTWGLLVSYRDMEDDEILIFSEEDDYTQFAVHAVYMWRHGKRVRPHVKFGLARTDFDARSPFFPSVSDDDVTISFGGGLEAGSDKIAFFADYDFTQPELELFGFSQDTDVFGLTLGIIFKY